MMGMVEMLADQENGISDELRATLVKFLLINIENIDDKIILHVAVFYLILCFDGKDDIYKIVERVNEYLKESNIAPISL